MKFPRTRCFCAYRHQPFHTIRIIEKSFEINTDAESVFALNETCARIERSDSLNWLSTTVVASCY